MIGNILHNLLVEQLLLETVSRNNIIDSITKFQGVVIYYDGDHIIKKGWRTIYPFVYGKNKWGNDAVRAFQMKGPSDSEDQPMWRMFRVDRIKSWYPSRERFTLSTHPDILKFYNPSDKDMKTIYFNVKLPRDINQYKKLNK